MSPEENPPGVALSPIVKIAFHGDAISTVKNEHTGRIYCLPREICLTLGLSWSAQFSKLRQSKLYQPHTVSSPILTDDRRRDTLLLDIDMMPSWLTSISIDRVPPDIQPKLLLYQQECSKALRDYWFLGQATNPRAGLEKHPDMRAIMDMALSVVQLREEQARMREAQERTQEAANQAIGMAHLAIQNQQWVSIRQYVFLHDLERQLTAPLQRDYARWLKGYCLEKGIPMYKALTVEKGWDKENTYYIGAISETLPGWLRRNSGGSGNLHLARPS